VSFELFPPKTPDAEAKLFDQTIPELLELKPQFMTCTYGAGGTTRDQTFEIVTRIRKQFGIDIASHLTCVGASRESLAIYLTKMQEHGVTNIVALRGDPPKDDPNYRPSPESFRLAINLVRFIKGLGDFDVAVAGYPEGHPECPDKYLDWQRCRDKVEAGADVVVSQLFYDNNDFLEFDDYIKNKLGVKVPIVPGVLPILSTTQIRRFCGMCGSKIPPKVSAQLERLANDNEACRQYGIDLATEMCDELIRHGVPGIHFYTLNRVPSTRAVMQNLGLADKP
jgi:methylenetetrahydrofolate reductase (NADPH)